MGTTLVIFAIGMTMYFVSGAAMIHMVMGLVLAVLTLRLLAAMARLTACSASSAFMDPWDPAAQGIGYHTVQSLLALGSGGLTGHGPWRISPEVRLAAGAIYRRYLLRVGPGSGLHRRGADDHCSSWWSPGAASGSPAWPPTASAHFWPPA